MNNQETLKKYTGAVLKGSIASVPFVGPLAVELFNVAIPNQRQERVEKLLIILSSKVCDIALEQLEEKFNSPDFIDIFEDILSQSVRATSDERLEYLASVLEYGIKQKKIEHLQIKRLLGILNEINDVEVILLQSYEGKNQSSPRLGQKHLEEKNQNNSEEFRQKHSSVFDTSKMNSEKASEHEVMLSNYKSHLINLGLIGKHSRSSQLHITKLGVMLLKKIGVKHDQERYTGEPINAIDAINSAIDKLEKKEKQIRRELEEDTKKAKTALEREIRNLTRRFRR